MVDYTKMDEKFYEDKTESSNLFQSWFHDSRNKITNNLVTKYYQPGMIIADLGCGNVIWNENKLPVTGIDLNENFLDYSFRKGRINKKIACHLNQLQLEDESVDIIIITEVLEHLPDLDKHLLEIRRVLKPGGLVISSVPYDTNISLWKPLFFIQCFYQGQMRGEKYYQEKCGHINNFSKKSIIQLFNKYKFIFKEQYNHSYFTIFTVFQK